MRVKSIHLLLLVLSATAVALVVFSLEQWAHNSFRPVAFDPSISKKLQKESPDIICVGNSTLSINIVKERFQKGLNERFGRPVKISYISAGGMHSAWQFLILKNQISEAVHKNIPVIFFDYEDFLLRPEAKTATSGKSEKVLRKLMRDDETIFHSKIGSNSLYFSTGFPYLYSQRYQIKRFVTSKTISAFMRYTRADTLIKSRRWKQKGTEAVAWLFGTIYKGSNFRSGQGALDERSDREAIVAVNPEQLQKHIAASFLPEMLAYKDRYTIIFLVSNSNPNMPLLKQSMIHHTAQLQEYIVSHGGYLVDMNRVASIQAPGLMHDSRHFTKGHPRELNTDMVLAELAKLPLTIP